jgi:hypothetical protein
MPWRSLWLTWCIFNFTHLIEVNKRIELLEIYAGKCTADWKTFALITLRRGCNALDLARSKFSASTNSWKYGDIADGYCRHEILISSLGRSESNRLSLVKE